MQQLANRRALDQWRRALPASFRPTEAGAARPHILFRFADAQAIFS